MKVADVMTPGVLTVGPDTPVDDAVRLMLDRHISGLAVVDGRGFVVGMVTEGDFLRRAEIGTERRRPRWLELLVGPGRLAADYVHSHARKVGEVMTGKVVSVGPEEPLADVVALMERKRIKRVPVIDGDRLVGIVTRADLLRGLAAAVSAPATAVGDEEIRRRILADCAAQQWTPPANLTVLVRDGVVDLEGIVFDERQREGLTVLCENVPGVKKVRDRLAFVEPISGTVIEAQDLPGRSV